MGGFVTSAAAFPTLRDEYEAAVRALAAHVDMMRVNGVESEQIARAAHAERRKLTASFKERTPEPARSAIYQRTMAVYGDPLGPSIEILRAWGRSWEEIAESATRPGRVAYQGDQLEFSR